MFRAVKITASLLGSVVLTFTLAAAAQSSYQVVSLTQSRNHHRHREVVRTIAAYGRVSHR